MSIYPQLLLNNPTRSVRRDIVDPGPQFLMPMEANGKIGPSASPENWILVHQQERPELVDTGRHCGHEFKKKTEVDLELYDQDDTERRPLNLKAGNQPSASASIVSSTGKDRSGSSGWWAGTLLPLTRTNGQPSWIASVGLQFVTSRKRRSSID